MERRRLVVEGCVQGVGFRPFVHDLALGLGLSGHVRNDSVGVVVEAEGSASRLNEFQEELRRLAPPLARLEAIRVSALPVRGAGGFRILESRTGRRSGARVPPDAATCDACLAELRDPADRRHRYPFLNCTRCGPRYTIVRGVPYDRVRTTLSGFAMCADCRREFDDPLDRRFHAQPTACPACGPHLALHDPQGRELTRGDPLEAAAADLLAGRIVAVKGLGGFHLACDATNGVAVRRLRDRKGRESKPFAVMVPDMEAAGRLCHLSRPEQALLGSFRRPIVLLRRRPGGPVADEVAPGLRELGVFLPYTPLHHLLLERVRRPLVLTSGNRSDEPIAYRDDEVASRLGSVVDRILTHDRPIQVPCDDSVVRVMAKEAVPLRRSRGYVPEAIPLPRESPEPILGVGGHLKATVCLVLDGRAVLSHHVGDLDHVASRKALGEAVRHLQRLLGRRPAVVAHDLHPDYASTRLALSLPDVARVAVQHHHAHVVSCMAEHGAEGPVIGVAFDGTGAGTDGAVWGGEFLHCTWGEFRRCGHLAYRRLPGGEAAVREPWRMAMAHLDTALPAATRSEVAARFLSGVPGSRRDAVRRLVEKGTASPVTSSVGRLFDGAAALLGIRAEGVEFEAQAAMEMEAIADPEGAEPFPVVLRDGPGGWTWDPSPLIRGLVEGRRGGIARERLAGAVHLTVARAVVEGCLRVRRATGSSTVALTGGVFQNRLLLERAQAGLEEEGFRVLLHRRVPPNDGGLSLGQAVAALGQRHGRTEEAAFGERVRPSGAPGPRDARVTGNRR